MVREYAFINLIRALAAFWVLASHCMIWGGWYGIPLPSPKIAVDLFILVSGFLMAANAEARSEREPLTEWSNWLKFWTRRLFRIAPAYYLALVLSFIAQNYLVEGYRVLGERPVNVDFSATSFLMHATFLFGLHPEYASSTTLPDWSLSLEMQFYFVFPALLVFMQARGHRWFLRSALILGGIAAVLGMAFARTYPDPSLLALKLQYFIVGMLVFRVLLTTGQERMELIAASVFLMCLELTYKLQLVVVPLLVVAMLLLGMMEARRTTPRWMERAIKSRIVRFASDTSYAVYLFHGFFIAACGFLLAGFSPIERTGLMFAIAATGSYAAGYAVFRLIEVPGIEVGRHFIRGMSVARTARLSRRKEREPSSA